MLNNGPISSAGQKQSNVLTFTWQAEYIAQHEAACKAVWLRGLLNEIGVFETVIEDDYPQTVLPPSLLYADNQGAIKFTENSEYYRKTKNIPIKYYKTCKLFDNRKI